LLSALENSLAKNPLSPQLYPLQEHDMTKVYAPYPPDDMRRCMVEFDEEYEKKFGKAAAAFEASQVFRCHTYG